MLGSNVTTIAIQEQDPNKTNLDLRIKWMANEINENEFKRLIVLREKKQRYTDRKHQVYDMVLTIFNDIQHKILQINDSTSPKISSCINEFQQITKYTNEYLHKLGKMYNYKTTKVMLIQDIKTDP